MGEKRERVVVLSENFGSFLGYASLLNELGYYSVSLAGSVREMEQMLDAGRRFACLVFDGFDLALDARHLQTFTRFGAITSIIVVADVNSLQRQQMFVWARTHGVPLRGVLQAPLRPRELEVLLRRRGLSVNQQQPALMQGA